MLHNPGGSGGVSLRNDRENRSICKVVYIFHIPPAKWCICDIYHLRQHRENGAISVYMYIYDRGSGDMHYMLIGCIALVHVLRHTNMYA